MSFSMNNNNFPGYYINNNINAITRLSKKHHLLKTVKNLEINDDYLWFKGYSIYLTAWCKKYLAILIFNPGFDFNKPFEPKVQYIRMVEKWHSHHWELAQRSMPYANHPKLFQFEDAIAYFQAKQILTNVQSIPTFLNLQKSEILRFLNIVK